MKASKLLIPILLVLALSVSSCGTARYVSIEDSLASEWVGKTHSDIVMEFGAPDREVSDGTGGVILVYENVTTEYDTDQSLIFEDDFTTTVSENRKFKHFFIDQSGICYNVKSNIEERVGKGLTRPERNFYLFWELGSAIVLAIPSLIAAFAY